MAAGVRVWLNGPRSARAAVTPAEQSSSRLQCQAVPAGVEQKR